MVHTVRERSGSRGRTFLRNTMKRSEINQYIREAESFFAQNHFVLPPFADWSLKDFQSRKREEIAEILDCELGWDVTDYGAGKYLEKGLFLFTIRNGKLGSKLYTKPYAEKIMISKENQVTPLHYHRSKMEDIINRGGGRLVFELYNSDPNDGLLQTPVTVWSDGVKMTVPAGKPFSLPSGASLTLPVGVYHSFYGEKGSGQVMIGEVSAVNDDHTDNVFYEKLPRYPEIQEDEEPYRLLVTDYAKFLR